MAENIELERLDSLEAENLNENCKAAAAVAVDIEENENFDFERSALSAAAAEVFQFPALWHFCSTSDKNKESKVNRETRQH